MTEAMRGIVPSLACTFKNCWIPEPAVKCPADNMIITVRGRAAFGSRVRYWAMPTMALGPLSSMPLVPSVWLLITVNSSLAPGMMPMTFCVVTGTILPVSVMVAVVLLDASVFSVAPTFSSTNMPGIGLCL